MRLLVAALVCAASAGVATASRAFCEAAFDGNFEAVKKSIRDGADVDYPCPTPKGTTTALFFASQDGHKEVVRFLLEAGADPNIVNHNGASPLFIAAQQNHDDVVRLLLAEVDPRGSILPSTGAGPLHIAAQLNSTAALRVLLDDGRLPVDGRSTEGHTPLHQAAQEGQRKAIEVLLRHGADASIAFNGKTPADIASRSGHDEVVALLTEAERKAAATKTFCPSLFAGNVEAVELAIRNGVDVDYRCPAQEGDGTQTALYDSSRYGDVDMIRLLLSKGAAVNSPDGYSLEPGSTALHAAAGGHPEAAQLLLRAGANASQTDANGLLPLHNAARWGYPEVIEVLSDEASVDINSRTDVGGTPIYYAALHGRVEVLRLLLERGADANIPDAQDVPPLYMAAEKNHSDVVRVLLEVVDPRRATWKGFSPLHVAADMGSIASLEVLLEDGRLSVNGQSANGATPLYYAARHGRLGSLETLLSYGADPSLARDDEFTPLYVAAERNHGDIVRLLLDVVDPYQSIRPNGWSPLHIAATNDAKEALETLLEDGRLPIDYLTDKGETPFYWAARNGSHRVVEILLARNADATIANNDGFQPLYAAAEQNQSDSLRLLLNVVDPRNAIKNPGGWSPLHIAAKFDSKAALEILLEDGRLDINGLSDDGWTPLYFAAKYSAYQAVEILLDGGADATIATNEGFYPLYVAARNDHGEVVRLLLEDSEVNPFEATYNPGGFTPLHAAAQFNATTALEALLDDGRLPINGLSDEGCTPLFYAAQDGALRAVKVLLRHGADASIEWKGKTPADIASQNGHHEVVALLEGRVLSEAFCAAVTDGDVEGVELLISQGVDVDYLCPYDDLINWRETALCTAASEGSTRMMEVLLRAGAVVNFAGQEGPDGRQTALILAADFGQTEAVQLLLRAGANASQVDGWGGGWEPLHYAASDGHRRVVEVLLDESKVDINRRNSNGGTPIYHAARNGHVEVVRLLLERGADATIANDKGFRPLYVAAEKNHSDTLRLLLDVDDPRQAIRSGGVSPLHISAKRGSKAALEVLCQDGRLSVNGRTENGTTPLWYAADHGRLGSAETLLRYGADPYQKRSSRPPAAPRPRALRTAGATRRRAPRSPSTCRGPPRCRRGPSSLRPHKRSCAAGRRTAIAAPPPRNWPCGSRAPRSDPRRPALDPRVSPPTWPPKP